MTNKAGFRNSSLFLYAARGHSLFLVSLLIFFLFSSPIDIFTKVSFFFLIFNILKRVWHFWCMLGYMGISINHQSLQWTTGFKRASFLVFYIFIFMYAQWVTWVYIYSLVQKTFAESAQILTFVSFFQKTGFFVWP